MSAVFVYEGKVRTLTWMVPEKLDLARFRLFKNNLVPTEATGIGDVVECDFSGYLMVTPVWDPVVPDAFGRATLPGSAVVFEHNGGGHF